jgi:hypothetical protein
MAIEDYYKELYYVDRSRQPDGTGGFEYVYKIGEKFSGSVTKASTSEQTVAGVKGVIGEQYTITTHIENVLEETDVVMFINRDNKMVFLKVNSIPTYTPEKSSQNHWKYAQATKFEPDLRVVN